MPNKNVASSSRKIRYEVIDEGSQASSQAVKKPRKSEVEIKNTRDPYESRQEWTSAQRNMIQNLQIGQPVGYLRFFHFYRAGNIAVIDNERKIVRTDEGYEFGYDEKLGRYVLRGDRHAFLVMYFEHGAKSYARYFGPVAKRRRVPVFRSDPEQSD